MEGELGEVPRDLGRGADVCGVGSGSDFLPAAPQEPPKELQTAEEGGAGGEDTPNGDPPAPTTEVRWVGVGVGGVCGGIVGCGKRFENGGKIWRGEEGWGNFGVRMGGGEDGGRDHRGEIWEQERDGSEQREEVVVGGTWG